MTDGERVMHEELERLAREQAALRRELAAAAIANARAHAELRRERAELTAWTGLYLDGQGAAVQVILGSFPAEARAANAELGALAAADELAQGSLESAERYLALAAQVAASVPAGRRVQAQLLLGIVRLLVARQRGNPPAVAEEAQKLQTMADSAEAAQPGLGDELRALALVSLGISEVWVAQVTDTDVERHLDQGMALARRIGRPYLEFTAPVYRAGREVRWSLVQAAESGMQAIQLARRHGWTDEQAVGIAYLILADVLAWQGRLEEAESWLRRAERTVRPETEPAAGLVVRYIRGMLEMVRGGCADALAALRTAERDALGDPSAAGRTVERALDLAEPDRALSAFLIHPAPGLLERHARDCAKHAAMISEILSLLPAEHEGRGLPGGLEGHGRTGSSLTRGEIPEGHPSGATEPPPRRLIEPLSQSEVRVLRYLPTNLTAPEIARELSVSVTTVRTHISHLFAKLDAHRRSEAVMRARALGLLAPSPRAPR